MASTKEILVTLPGGRRVEARVGTHVVRTDQPRADGGEDTAPSPYDLFLASLGTCAGIFIQGFCARRGIPFEGIRVRETVALDGHGTLKAVHLTVELPPSFPQQYLEAVTRVVDQCTVKRAIQAQPTFEVHTRLSDALMKVAAAD